MIRVVRVYRFVFIESSVCRTRCGEVNVVVVVGRGGKAEALCIIFGFEICSNIYGVFVSKFVSPQAAELCERQLTSKRIAMAPYARESRARGNVSV